MAADFPLESLFTSEVEVGEGGMTFLPPFSFILSHLLSKNSLQSHTIFAGNHPSRHQRNSRKS